MLFNPCSGNLGGGVERKNIRVGDAKLFVKIVCLEAKIGFSCTIFIVTQ